MFRKAHTKLNTKHIIYTIVAIAMIVNWVKPATTSATAYVTLDIQALYQMAENGQGQDALQAVANVARDAGNWQAAPGDAIAFDRYMPRTVRGAVIDFDEMPDCDNPMVSPDPQMCRDDFRMKESQVRFGMSFFTTEADDGLEYRTPDDVLATYIEETGHSWQEYLFETDGNGDGSRLHETTMDDAKFWSAGREYQVKMYILNLDGKLLELSDSQRSMLLAQVCEGDAYANPLGKEVPSYGAPANWPYPEGWPTEAPSLSAHMDFCASQLS